MPRAPTPSAAVTAKPPWLFSPAIDLTVGCGAWSLPLLVATFLLQREHAAAVAFAFYLLAVFCNNPHYMATIYRAYRTPADFAKYRFFTVYVTVLLALTVVLVHLVPGLFPWVVTFYLTWSPWHYTGQNFGIAQMLVRRAGAPADPAARRLLWWSYATSYGVWLLTLHAAREAGDPYFVSLGVPAAVAVPLQLALALAFLVCAGAAFARLARTLPLRACAGPLTLTFAQGLWFVVPALLVRFVGVDLPASYFSAGALAFIHCAQYLWITTYYTRRETPAGATFRPGRYYLALVVGGIALFVPGPWLASRLLRHDFVESFVIFMALVNLHHFILDGAIWKLRDGRIAQLLLGRNPPARDALDALAPTASASAPSHLGWLFGPTPAARAGRWTLGGAILALGALDQLQYFSTAPGAPDAALARAAALNPYDPRPGFRRAQESAAAGDTATARRELAHLLAVNPRNAPAQHLLGELLFRSGDTAAALAHYDGMAALFPADFGVAINRGLLAGAAGDTAKALASFERAARLQPADPLVHHHLAGALAAAGQPARASDEYARLIAAYEADPQPATFENFLDACCRRAALLAATPPADTATAEKLLQRAADLAATRHHFSAAARALNQLADLQVRLGRPAEAARNRTLATQAASYAP